MRGPIAHEWGAAKGRGTTWKRPTSVGPSLAILLRARFQPFRKGPLHYGALAPEVRLYLLPTVFEAAIIPAKCKKGLFVGFDFSSDASPKSAGTRGSLNSGKSASQ